MEAFGFLSMISSAALSFAGIFITTCSQKRTYTSLSNRILLANIVKSRLSSDATCRGGEVYTDGVWVPTMMCSVRKCYCSTLDAQTSGFSNEVIYKLTVFLFPCMSWKSFERSNAAASNDAHEESSFSESNKNEEDTACVQRSLTKLPHLVRKGVQLAWPSWSIEHRYILPPGVDDCQLETATSLAARMKSQINEISGSAFFLVRGPKRTGKSTAAKLLARMLGRNTLVCEDYNPTEPGNLLTNLISCRRDHDDATSLVIILEECDEWLQKIRDGHVFPQNPELFTEVTGKSKWCPFAEKVLKMNRVVVICTCNMTDADRLTYDVKLEGAMLREERITAEYRTTVDGGFDVIHESSKTPTGPLRGEQFKPPAVQTMTHLDLKEPLLKDL